MLNVKIKKLYPDAKIPTYGSKGAACADLYAYLDDNTNRVQVAKDGRRYIEIKPHCTEKISSGVAMELPEGYYAQVVPRSSTCKTFGIIMANSIGIIEHNYSGNEDVWGFPAVAIRHTVIPKGSRICQFHLVKQDEPVEFEQVDDLGNPNRGGWGSTGSR